MISHSIGVDTVEPRRVPPALERYEIAGDVVLGKWTAEDGSGSVRRYALLREALWAGERTTAAAWRERAARSRSRAAAAYPPDATCPLGGRMANVVRVPWGRTDIAPTTVTPKRLASAARPTHLRPSPQGCGTARPDVVVAKWARDGSATGVERS